MTRGRGFESLQVDELAAPREETLVERAVRTGEPLRCGTVLDLVPPAEIDAVIRESFDAHFEGAFLREVERGMGLPSGTLIADVPAPALFAAEYQNEPPPAPTIEELREFVRTADRGRVRIGTVLADCPETVRRAFAAADPPSLPVADVFGIPVRFSALVRPGTIALLDRSGVPLLVVDVPADGAST